MYYNDKGERADTQVTGTDNGSNSLTCTSLGVKKIKEKMIILAIISLLSSDSKKLTEKNVYSNFLIRDSSITISHTKKFLFL